MILFSPCFFTYLFTYTFDIVVLSPHFLLYLLVYTKIRIFLQQTGKSTVVMNDDFEVHLKGDESQFIPNFESQMGIISRRIFLFHTLQQVIDVRQIFAQNQKAQKQQKNFLQAEQVYNIRQQDDCLHVGQQMFNTLKLLKGQKKKMEENDVFWMMFQVFKMDIVRATIFLLLEAAFKMGFSIILQFLFQAVSQQNIQLAYILAVSGGLCWLTSQIARHNAFYESPIISGKIRSGFIFMILRKLSKISLYSVKSQQTGKIINMLSNDFNLIELKSPVFFAGLIFPFSFTGITIILILRLGWPAVCGIVLTLLLFPLQIFIGKKNGSLLEEVNVYKDQRLKTCAEIIDGIKFIKLYGWEIAFKKIIQQLRHQQIRNYLRLSIGRSLQRALANISSVWAGLLSFTVMYFSADDHLGLNVPIIFSTLELMVFLRLQIFFFGIAIGFVFQLKVIIRRLISVLEIQELHMIKIDPQTKVPLINNTKPNKLAMDSQQRILEIKLQPQPSDLKQPIGSIVFKKFQGYWTKQNFETPTLKNINLHLHPNKFYGITGKIGSGKSGLLGVMLKQIPYYSGQFYISGSISYVEQQPIIFSMTIQKNILYGKEFDSQLYQKALHDSCLETDLQLLQNGDQTLVGQKGVSLSGGQKARLALARAIYADGDIFLLDDPISAVDSKVARQIYDYVIRGNKGQKTIVLVTHQISYLDECDHIIIMNNGTITSFGCPNSLKAELQNLLNAEKPADEEVLDEKQKLINEKQREEMRLQMIQELRKRKESASQSQTLPVLKSINKQEKQVSVTFKSYINYIFYTDVGKPIFVITILLFLLAEGTNTTYIRFLSLFDNLQAGQSNLFNNGDMRFYWGIMWLLSICFFLLSIIKYFSLNTVALLSNEKIHEQMIHGLVRSPSWFFDITTSGRLINKFSNDLGIMDNTLAFTLTDTIQGPIVTAIMLVNIFQINLIFIPFGIFNFCFLVFFFIFCKQAIVQSKQMDLRTKSPMFNILAQTIEGLIQVHIYNRRDSLLKQFAKAVNNSLRSNLCFWLTSRAFGTYVSYVSIMVLIGGFVVGVYNTTLQTGVSTAVATGLYGVSVVFLVQINDYLQWFLRQIIGMESIMVSVERAFQITSLESESVLRSDYDLKIGFQEEIRAQNHEQQFEKTIIRTNWPKNPKISLKDVSMRYRDGLPLILKGVSFQINPNEKVGIVGRTGAGKSSIIQALFRIVQTEKGTYQVDKCDAKKMGLHSLRQHISVIPQTPFIFKGSVRENLDPFNKSTDEELWKALQESGLSQAVKKLPKQLDTDISNTSQTFSVGQKQLLCLGRALLRRNRILVLDQATSNVDMQTDDFIQQVLKEKFKETTVITIAHRLNTIADYDKVIVMNRGRVVEVGSPFQLINSNGIFSQMVHHTGKNANNIINIAKKAYQKKHKK